MNTRFGRLQVIEYRNSQDVICRCDCGNIKSFHKSNLIRGRSKSCGCYRREYTKSQFKKHGQSDNWLHSCWQRMRNRCNNPNNPGYHYYGGRGIKVCDRWNDFENFAKDLGEPPDHTYSLERIDNDKGYEPDNCRWATRAEQSNNRRSCIPVTIGNETHNVAEWLRIIGMTSSAYYRRISKGFNPQEVIKGFYDTNHH